MLNKQLTKKQAEVLDYIKKFYQKNNYSPALSNIAEYFNVSIPTIHQHVDCLKRKGYLKTQKGIKHSIQTTNVNKVFNIPLIGTIAAGQPIEAIEDFQELISVSNTNIKNEKDYYALRVAGNSMIDEGIFDGDTVIIKKQSVAENGQTVVAIIDDEQATLKKLYRENGKFRLQPRNPNMKPLFRTEVEIRGIVVQVISNINNNPENQPSKKTKHGFKTIDLFAGVGGIRIGFERAGFETVFANDFEQQCKNTYDLNFKKSKLIVEDIRKIGIKDLPEFDFLLGGFPCQAFSIAGYQQGFKDKKNRGNLFFDIARIIEATTPEGFLLENVKNLKSHDGGKTFKIIKETLENLGYHIRPKVLNSMEYGNIPQNRERIYIVGFKNKDYADKFSFPEPIKLTKKITDLLEKNVPEKYYYNGKPLFEKLKNVIKEEGKVYQWRRQYVRENKSGVCPTLTANMGTGGHNVPIIKDKKGIRKLTPLECFKIQGFPQDYVLPKISDSALYKQAGNSVSVPVVEAVAKQMMKAMLAN
jgi:DNA (cytosine-5)-methyltransferase 1